MVIDRLENSEWYGSLSRGLAEGLAFLAGADLLGLPIGRHEVGLGAFAIMQEYETKPLSQGAFEAHRKYIDIQYVISGCEQIGWAPLPSLTETSDYDEEKDIQWFSGEGSMLLVPAGTFMILRPNDAHRPCIQVGQQAHVRKVVVKVPA